MHSSAKLKKKQYYKPYLEKRDGIASENSDVSSEISEASLKKKEILEKKVILAKQIQNTELLKKKNMFFFSNSMNFIKEIFDRNRKKLLKWLRFISFPFIWKKNKETKILRRKMNMCLFYEINNKNLIQVRSIWEIKKIFMDMLIGRE